jgi:hypothetical protein
MIAVGSRVRVSTKWVRSVGLQVTNDPRVHGFATVVGMEKLGPLEIAVLRWDHGESSKMNVKNLVEVGTWEPN